MWRIAIGLALIPAFGTLYQRLTLPEATRYLASRARPEDTEAFKNLKQVAEKEGIESEADQSPTKEDVPEEDLKRKAHFSGTTGVLLLCLWGYELMREL